MTLQDLYREGIRKLTENEVPEAELNAWYLLQSCLSEEPFSYTRSRFFLEQMEQAAPETITSYMEKVSKRKEHIPLEYILGYTEFMGLTFLTNAKECYDKGAKKDAMIFAGVAIFVYVVTAYNLIIRLMPLYQISLIEDYIKLVFQ